MTVRHVKKDERNYYEELLKYSREHLMLYPYHLSDIMVKGLRVTPFSYYISIMEVKCAFVPFDCNSNRMFISIQSNRSNMLPFL